MNKKILLIILLLLNKYSSYATFFGNENLAIHPKFGVTYNFHNADFSYFKNAVSCGNYKNGDGIGYIASFSIERNLFSRTQLSLGFSYINRSGELFFDTIYQYRNAQNQIANGNFRSTITSNLYYLEVQPDLRFTLFTTEKIAMRFFAGASFSFPVLANFTQEESILSPDDAYFTNSAGQRFKNRTLANGEIGNLRKVNIGPSLGIDNCLKLSENLSFTQQVSLDYNFTNVTTDTDWKTHSLNFSLGLRYSFKSDEEFDYEHYEYNKRKDDTIPEKTEPVIVEKTEKIEEPELIPQIPSLKIAAGDFTGEIHNGIEFLATAPIVNAVFFEKNSAKLPNYLRFEHLDYMDYFRKDALELHNYILPHIADILQKNPKATIIIEGATAGIDFEQGGLSLAAARADTIKAALLRLGADAKRIKTSSRLTPRIISNNQYFEGVTENQRVDIFVQNAALQLYTYFVNFSELLATREYFTEVSNSSEPAKVYNLQADSTISVKDSGTFTFNIKKRIQSLAAETELVNKTMISIMNLEETILDTINYSELQTIDVSENYDNFEAIIRFDYNSSVLTAENKSLLREMVEKLPENCGIQILGSADALGLFERNEQLTTERANVTRNYISNLTKNTIRIETGASTQKFAEETPAGRFLNRCIIVKIKKI